MSTNSTLDEATQQNAVVLAAVGDLVAGVISEISGNEISSSIAGQTLTRDTIQSLVNQEILNLVK